MNLVAPLPDRRSFRFRIGPKVDLPVDMVAYAILRMRQLEGNASLSETGGFNVNLDRLLWAPFSPGMVFKLDGETLVSYIEQICSKGLLGKASYSTDAGMKQLTVSTQKPLIASDILEAYYGREA